MAGSDFEIRLAPEALKHWAAVSSRDARLETHAILEELRRSGTAPRTFSLLDGPERRSYGRLVKVLFHRDESLGLISVTDIVAR